MSNWWFYQICRKLVRLLIGTGLNPIGKAFRLSRLQKKPNFQLPWYQWWRFLHLQKIWFLQDLDRLTNPSFQVAHSYFFQIPIQLQKHQGTFHNQHLMSIWQCDNFYQALFQVIDKSYCLSCWQFWTLNFTQQLPHSSLRLAF